MLDVLFPTYCLCCGQLGEYLCSVCKKKLINNLPECYYCRKLSPQYLTHKECSSSNIDAVFVGWQYNSVARKLMAQYKYRYAYKLSKILSELLIQRLTDTRFLETLGPSPILLPVPIHRDHQTERGFNQSLLIAQFLSMSLRYEVVDNIITRVGDNSYQSKSNFEQRKELEDVFKIKDRVSGRNIVIVDDVITTGSTLNSLAKTLKGNSIKAITLFRGRPHFDQRSFQDP
jgi:competence protein ComFC